MCKPVFQAFVLFFAAFYVSLACVHFSDWISCAPEGSEWTFKCLQQRGTPGSSCEGSGVSGVYFLSGGISVSPVSSRSVNDVLVVNTDRASPRLDGWCFLTNSDDPSKDAVRFALEVSDAGGQSVPVGSSTRFPRFAGGSGFYNEFFNTTVHRNVPVCFQFCSDSAYHFVLGLVLLIGCAAYVSAVVDARGGRPDTANKKIGYYLLLVTCTTLTFGSLAVRRGCSSGANEFLVIPPQVVWLMYAMLVDEAFFTRGLLGVSISGTVCAFATLQLGDPQLLVMLLLNSFIFGWACYFSFATWRARRRARQLVQPDKARYEQEWEAMLAKHGAELETLRRVVDGCAASKVKEVVQMHRREDGTPVVEVTSLDELYDGASAAEPVFLAHVQRWAWERGGLFARLEKGQNGAIEFGKWAEAVGCCSQSTPVLDASIRWAHLKKVERSIEKLFRVYNGKVSPLVDLCRQDIVFDTPLQLRTCLEAILADASVHVERIKNRYDAGYESEMTAGYRDVCLNLRMVACPSLTVREHVCELQLLVRPFAQLKHEAGHARYVQFRNLRGM